MPLAPGRTRLASLTALALAALVSPAMAPAAERPLRVIIFGAHPDDCDQRAGGTAAMWAAKGRPTG
jgi:hypothetical protein